MTLEELTSTLDQLFDTAVQSLSPGSFQIETAQYRLLVLLSDDQTWLRVLLPIAPGQQGLDDSFNAFAEKQIRQIIQASKRQGQSLEATMQTLDRFYEEGLMGDMAMGERSREETMAAWQRQLERLWNDEER
jgi:hypothetical protein